MKKILSVALSTAMAFSMFASVAFGDTAVSPQQQFDALKAKGIFTGYPDGTAGLDKDMTRAEFAKVITKLLGLKEITGTLSYTDKNYTAKNWAVPYIEAVTAAGIMEGKNVEKKIFDFNGKVTVSEMATILTRALDLEIPAETNNSAADWAKGYVQAAINAGLIDSKANFGANASRELLVGAAYAIDQAQSLKVASYEVSEAGKVVTFKISDGESVKVTLDKALEANKETEVKFTYKDKEFTEKVTYVVTSATKVESVKASNLKEIDVAFDGKVDKLTAEDKDRYSVDSSVVIESAALQSDEKTVRLTVVGALQNQKVYKISVRNVKAGDRTVSVTNQEFTPLDNALPEVATVKSLGTKAVKVTFTEPVKSATSANFKLDGKTFFGSVTEGKRDVILKPYSSTDLTVGAHKLEVSGVEDFNGFKALTKEVEFEVVSDTTAPTIANVTATLEKATVTFSEEIDPDTLSKSNVYWKSGNDKKAADSFTQVSPEVYEFSFKSNPFPGYETPFFVENVKDYSGNQITATETKLRAEVDQTRPEVTEVTLNSTDNKVINVKFSKEVKVEDVKYFTLTKADGKTVALKSVVGVDGTSEDKAFKLSTYDALTEDSYTLKIVGVRDTTKLNNTMLDYTATVTGKDNVAPKYSGNSAKSSTRTLYISFNKALNPVTVGDKSNYLVKINGTDQQLPSGTEVTPVNEGKGIRIVFPQYIGNDAVGINSGFAADITHFTLLGLKDTANNVIDTFAVPTEINTNAAKVAIYETGVTEQARLTEEGTIKVRFDQPISTVKAGDFEVTQGSVSSATADGTNLVTLKISGLGKTGLTSQTSATPLILSVKAGNTIKTVTGNVVDDGAVIVKDTVKPQVQLASGQTRLTVENNRTILLPFSEVLKSTDAAKYAEDVVVRNVRTGDLLSTSQYSTSVDGNVLKITLAGTLNSTDDYNVSVRSDATSLQDLAGNLAVSSSVYATQVGQINTVATGAVASQTAASAVPGVAPTDGTKQVEKLNLAGVVTTAGIIDVTFTVGSTVTSKPVTVALSETATDVATKIKNAFGTELTGFDVDSAAGVVTFTSTNPVANKTVTITAVNNTAAGITGTQDATPTQGVASTTGTKQKEVLTVTSAPTKKGVNTVTFKSTTIDVSAVVSVEATDTTDVVAGKIVTAINAKLDGYTASAAGSVVTFTADEAAAPEVITVTFN